METQWDRRVDASEVSPAAVADDAAASVARGSYNAGPTFLDPDAEDGAAAVVEHCLGFDDAPKTAGAEGKRARVRVQQHLRFDASSKTWALKEITAWKEFYYEPFNNAASLCASCGGPNKWGEYPVMPEETFTEGEWEGDEWDGFVDRGDGLVLLPTGIYSQVAKDETTGDFFCSAGWFVPDRDASYLPPSRDVETHLASRRSYGDDGALRHATFAKRERASTSAKK